MSDQKGKMAGWALKLIIAIIGLVVAAGGQLIAPGNLVSAVAGIVAIVGAVWGTIEYLLTKRQA